jgi:PPOX class probable F420-dependent enzyme
VQRDAIHRVIVTGGRLGSVIDESTEFGARAARRLREEPLAWLTTVDGRGTPQPVPVWFLWDGADGILLYSRPGTAKLRNVEVNPRVSLHLDGNGQGGDIVVCIGAARVSDDPPADRVPEYVEKYGELVERNRWTPESFAADYAVPLRITITRIRGH